MQPQINMFPQQYSQPVIIANQGGLPPQNLYAINQNCVNNVDNVDNVNNVNNITFGGNPGNYLCPHCKMNVTSNIEDKCNCLTCIIYLIMFIIFPIYIIYVICIDIEYCSCEFECACTNDGLCCYPKCCSCPNRQSKYDNCQCCCDTQHYCSNCGKLIGTKNSCIEICPPCCRCC